MTGNFVRELLHAFAAAGLPATASDVHPLVGPNGAQIWFGVTQVRRQADSADLAPADRALEIAPLRWTASTGQTHPDLAQASSRPAETVA